MSLPNLSTNSLTRSVIESVSGGIFDRSPNYLEHNIKALENHLSHVSPEEKLNTMRYIWGEQVDGYVARELVDKVRDLFTGDMMVSIQLKKSSLSLGYGSSDLGPTLDRVMSTLGAMENLISRNEKTFFAILTTEKLKAQLELRDDARESLEAILEPSHDGETQDFGNVTKEKSEKIIALLKRESEYLSQSNQENQREIPGDNLEALMGMTPKKFDSASSHFQNAGEESKKDSSLV